MNSINSISANTQLLISTLRTAKSMYPSKAMDLGRMQGQLIKKNTELLENITWKGLVIDQYV